MKGNSPISRPRQNTNSHLFCLVVVMAVAAAYYNSFSGAFVFDDKDSILENPTIRHLWPMGDALSPPAGTGWTVAGRPLVNLSLAVNYALGGAKVWGYHLFNLAVHLLACLTLFGIVRRTLSQPVLRQRFGAAAGWLGVVVAVLWGVHPLQTESVTYVVQRAESLMGLFYLLTLYCFIRGTEARAARWHSLAFVACLCGMATKEVMVTAPFMVLLYDRTFVAGTFRKALGQRRRLYAGLAVTWLLLAWLVATGGSLGGGRTGVGSNLSWHQYGWTQFGVITRYLWLTLWPRSLALDYGGAVMVTTAAQAVPCAFLIILLVAGTVISLRRWPVVGFAGCWFFGILALTSSVFPLSDTMFEHRMYLPLAAVVALGVLGVYRRLGRRSFGLFMVVGLAWMALTVRRNRDYQSEFIIWSDTVVKRPNSSRAHNNLGAQLVLKGQADEAISHFKEAVRLKPNFAEAYNNLGPLLVKKGQIVEAISQYQQALRYKTNYAEAHYNLGIALVKMGRMSEAISQFETALRLKPNYAEAHNDLGVVLANGNQMDEAISQYQAALRLKPDYADAHVNLGNVFVRQNRMDEGISQYQEAIRLQPDKAEVYNNLGLAFAGKSRFVEAINQYRSALRLKPDYADAANNLGNALIGNNQIDEAIGQYQAILLLQPNIPESHNNLGFAFYRKGRMDEAIQQFREALRLRPDFVLASNNLAGVLELKKAASGLK